MVLTRAMRIEDMATLDKLNKLPNVTIDDHRTVEYEHTAEFRPDPTRLTETLTVMFRSAKEGGVIMRAVEADFEFWSDSEKMELIGLLSKFCIKSLEERHDHREE